MLRDGKFELVVDAELGADAVEKFKELLTLGTSQNPSVASAAHCGAAVWEIHPTEILDVSADEHQPGRAALEDPGVCAYLAGKSGEIRVAVVTALNDLGRSCSLVFPTGGGG